MSGQPSPFLLKRFLSIRTSQLSLPRQLCSAKRRAEPDFTVSEVMEEENVIIWKGVDRVFGLPS